MSNLRVGIVSPRGVDVSDDDVVIGDETGRGRRLVSTARKASAPPVATEDDELEPELQALVKTLRRVPPLPRDVRTRALARAQAIVDAAQAERRRPKPVKAVRDDGAGLRRNATATDVRR